MGGVDVCMYVGVDLLWRLSRNYHTWGLGVRYTIGRVNLVNWALVSCGGVLGSYFGGDGDVCRYVGVDVSLGQVMAARRSLRMIFAIISQAL